MSEQASRQFVRFLFGKVSPRWRELDAACREESKAEAAAVIEEFAGRMLVRAYSTVGTRADTDFLLWQSSPRLEDFQELQTRLWATGLGPYLDFPYAYLAMTRRSQYVARHQHEGQEGTRLRLSPVGAKYLFVYPFVKTRAWYALPLERRQAMMDEHIRIGHRYPSVRLNTTYSFGLDDQEFVVAFESDHPADFLDLVMELRESEASAYTLRDTPIFTCIAMSPRQVLDALGG